MSRVVPGLIPLPPTADFILKWTIKYLPKKYHLFLRSYVHDCPLAVRVSLCSPMSPMETLYPPQCAASYSSHVENHPAMSKQCPLVEWGRRAQNMSTFNFNTAAEKLLGCGPRWSLAPIKYLPPVRACVWCTVKTK